MDVPPYSRTVQLLLFAAKFFTAAAPNLWAPRTGKTSGCIPRMGSHLFAQTGCWHAANLSIDQELETTVLELRKVEYKTFLKSPQK